MRKIVVFILLVTSGSLFASARIVHPWSSVHIQADQISIDAKLSGDSSHLEELRIKAGSRPASAPRSELAKIPNPRLNTIEIEWSCFDATAPIRSQKFIDQCRQLISIGYDDSEEGVPYGEELPTATFVFSNGAYIETRL
jgi:hypothetical protein